MQFVLDNTTSISTISTNRSKRGNGSNSSENLFSTIASINPIGGDNGCSSNCTL